MKEKVICGSHIKKKTRIREEKKRQAAYGKENLFFYFFSSFTSLFDIRESDRQNSSGQEQKGSTRRGLRVGTKNTGFRRVFN